MAGFNYDFSGYATKSNFRCSDGRVIKPNAFVDNDGKIVPLVWQHNHSEPFNILGHALLENREDGVYAYCSLNDTEMAEHVKQCIAHGDLKALSIYANKLKELNKIVSHGDIKEVSVVIAGANPGAFIDNVLFHGDEEVYPDSFAAEIRFYNEDEPGIVFESGELSLSHADDSTKAKTEDTKEDTKVAEEKNDKTVEDVLNELNDEQKAVVEYVINETVKAALEAAKEENSKEEKNMKHSVFESAAETTSSKYSISKDEMNGILMHAASPNVGSLKVAVQNFIDMNNEKFLAHDDEPGDDPAQTYGITDIGDLFPDAKNYTTTPDFIKRRTEWVNVVLTGVHHTPFSRIRSIHADITGDEARARGYTKGNLKIEEVFGLLKRETSPTTVYKKQKIDRDDKIDITDFDVVLWLKGEMRLMWEEEVARAILIGDGRDPVTQATDKIKEDCIRPIWTDAELYTVPERIEVASNATDDARTKALIRKIKKSRKDYKGSGNPVFFTTIDFLTDCLLLEDGMGRPLYDTVDKLATALMVSRIVTVEVMENKTRVVKIDNVDTTMNLVGLIVNLNDYNVGADKGGQAEMFEDFDIDYNQYKYLYEGRMSGALVKPFSALAIEYSVASAG